MAISSPLYIEAPTEFDGTTSALFLAGGISHCPNWQKIMVEHLQPCPWTLLNPRRTQFSLDDAAIARQQIEWEHRHLRLATAILFWFPRETLCPIALYELGAWSMTDKPLFVGVHPHYPRRQDVEIQTTLVRPDIEIVDSLDVLAQQVIQASDL